MPHTGPHCLIELKIGGDQLRERNAADLRRVHALQTSYKNKVVGTGGRGEIHRRSSVLSPEI
jgi:hypothetical protein